MCGTNAIGKLKYVTGKLVLVQKIKALSHRLVLLENEINVLRPNDRFKVVLPFHKKMVPFIAIQLEP